MIPAHVLVLDAFPLTANMKVDRAALPRPAGAPRAGMVRVPPATRLEERVAAIWRDILELQEIGMEENFFDLGGNSLLVVRLCSAINSALGVDLQVTELFDLPTVRQLARRLGDAPGAAASSRRDPGSRRSAARPAARRCRRNAACAEGEHERRQRDRDHRHGLPSCPARLIWTPCGGSWTRDAKASGI